MPKYTLLDIVQKILSDMDSEPVNSIGDSSEAQQVASIVEDTYYNLISNRTIPEHKGLLKLESLSDSDFPTHFKYPASVNNVEKVWYDKSDDDSFDYKEVHFLEPFEFLRITDSVGSEYIHVEDKSAKTFLRIRSDKHPEFYTSFDDEHIVMDSWRSDLDTTLMESKTRAYGTTYPSFETEDSFVPDIDDNYFPYLLAESKSVCMSLLKGASDPKIEQAAKRQKSYIQNDRYRTKRANKWSNYGRT